MVGAKWLGVSTIFVEELPSWYVDQAVRYGTIEAFPKEHIDCVDAVRITGAGQRPAF
jgi:hypothetical protein